MPRMTLDAAPFCHALACYKGKPQWYCGFCEEFFYILGDSIYYTSNSDNYVLENTHGFPGIGINKMKASSLTNSHGKGR